MVVVISPLTPLSSIRPPVRQPLILAETFPQSYRCNHNHNLLDPQPANEIHRRRIGMVEVSRRSTAKMVMERDVDDRVVWRGAVNTPTLEQHRKQDSRPPCRSSHLLFISIPSFPFPPRSQPRSGPPARNQNLKKQIESHDIRQRPQHRRNTQARLDQHLPSVPMASKPREGPRPMTQVQPGSLSATHHLHRQLHQ